MRRWRIFRAWTSTLFALANVRETAHQRAANLKACCDEKNRTNFVRLFLLFRVKPIFAHGNTHVERNGQLDGVLHLLTEQPQRLIGAALVRLDE